ncbi:MAG: prephenate dehydrogenase [Bryobacteraceae bacterium]|nr:prephenate dehydrogenase [Bryobacterales bacterium]NUN03324.1 prephenate dehydrogenase [Bryobacteraceae bacterium]
MRTVAIIGVGLIGGSFALALRKAGFDGTILGVSSRKTLDKALKLGAIDEPSALSDAARRADLLYLAQPIRAILETITSLEGCLKPGTLVTDAGSTKREIVEAATTIRSAQFLGGHPMAGKEVRGVAAADAALFAGRTYVLTPRQPDEMDTGAVREFRLWLERIGSQVLVLSPEEHDRVVAFTSHLPQLASTALASLLAGTLHSSEETLVAGPGLQDATRLALSDYEIWSDILQTNTGNIRAALRDYIDRLQQLEESLNSDAAAAHFRTAAAFARLLRTRR